MRFICAYIMRTRIPIRIWAGKRLIRFHRLVAYSLQFLSLEHTLAKVYISIFPFICWVELSTFISSVKPPQFSLFYYIHQILVIVQGHREEDGPDRQVASGTHACSRLWSDWSKWHTWVNSHELPRLACKSFPSQGGRWDGWFCASKKLQSLPAVPMDRD